MLLKTPTRFKFEKKVHTPPSSERDGSRTSKSKFLKGISGKVFRRTPDMKQQQASTFEEFSPFTPSAGLNNSKRHIPKPLNLSKPLSPPPTISKHDSFSRSSSTLVSSGRAEFGDLDSPVHLQQLPNRSANRFSSKNLTRALIRESSASSRTSSDVRTLPNSDIIVWTDAEDNDPYLEESSPTFLATVNRNMKKYNSNHGPKKFVGERCAVCQEGLNNNFAGEKIVELSCSHPNHYSCYLTMLGSIQGNNSLPKCYLCGQITGPTDTETLQEMKSKLLGSNGITTSTNQQWIDLSPRKTYFPQFTPLDRVIHTADISQDGFKMPPLTGRDDSRSFVESIHKENIFSNTELKNPFQIEKEEIDCKNEESYEVGGPEIIRLGDNSFDCKITIPNLDTKPIVKERILNKSELREESLIRTEIVGYFEEILKINEDIGKLLLFEKCKYSVEGEEWSFNIIFCFYERLLILFDFSNEKIVGRVPVDRVYDVTKISDLKILIGMKSTILPEMYIEFCGPTEEKTALKWKYYIENLEKVPLLNHITSSTTDFLPESLAVRFKSFAKNADSFSPRPWVLSNFDAPLQLIVCMNLSSFADENEDYISLRKKTLSVILEKLGDDDLLGLVLVGKDGSGNVGEYGTFVGTIDKKWQGWEDVLETMDAVKKGVFQDQEKEMQVFLQTCYRLTSTLQTMEEIPTYSKHIIILREKSMHDEEDILIRKYRTRVIEDQKFSIDEVELDRALLESNSLKNIIDNYHKENVNSLIIKKDGKSMRIGNMSIGDEKVVNLKKILDDGAYGSIIDIELEWFDLAKGKVEKRKCPLL
ncbi:hypothetical protein KAFR_0F01840 [Kazachstania africana CBS 2517]|uniref:RING-type domain-containing protein n=1 Tax=Kazachstania africana (strain ATCC 22294 / BCRC 22015 / CBS 2517 / CECT 1963 / NBRC 1671 / NRRL Y-8276) TaxID=1071382 RepID=H2AWN1_KAZAF|nr:hypothetical protein KAFR_0F01840 [Kazachstania africana CBS 2517]CCF58781.1 hypothetical protein KAFR_0F01840 [Kazachstania africana CBS 2517]